MCFTTTLFHSVVFALTTVLVASCDGVSSVVWQRAHFSAVLSSRVPLIPCQQEVVKAFS